MFTGLLVTIYCLLFTYLANRKTDWAIYIIAASLPSYLIRFELLSIPLTLLEAMVIILFGVFLIKNKLSWLKNFYRQPFFGPTISLLFFATLAMFLSPQLRAGAGIWKAYFIEPIMFFIVVTNTINSTAKIKKIIWALGLSLLYLSAVALAQKIGWLAETVPAAFLKPTGQVDRVVSLFGYPNALGLYFGPLIILFSGFLFWGDKKTILQAAKLAIIVVGLIIIILAQSEAAIISIVAVWLLLLLINKKTRLPATMLLLLAVALFFLNPDINQYLSAKLLLKDYSGFIRRLIWQESWQMLKDNWLFGAGLAGYQTKIANYHLPTFEIFLYPHNIFLNFWSELGLIGLLVFGWLNLKFCWNNLRAVIKRNQNYIFNLFLLAIMVQFFIHGLVDAPYLKNDLSMLFWLILAFYVINDKIIHQPTEIA
ncbi:MAG TPA: O-antigen ligase family protein [bacterium]|nr:O-antigen ligase family protein [bacterium]HNS34261.1 O-antigen ligase family protein [bacterium]HOH67431.1 O-antigen ligase family protein [bacterium]HQA63848.1 O-antigen ligase family protein [bacterium]